MTINIMGNRGEFFYSIVTDGKKCSILEQDSERIMQRFGKISINGDLEDEDKQKRAELFMTQCARNHAKQAVESDISCAR